MRWALLVALLLIQGCASNEAWRTSDTVRQVGYTAVLAYDMRQTSRIQYHNDLTEGHPFTNAVLGDNPKTSEVWQYAVTMALSNWFISHALPQKWRPYWQTSTLVIHGIAIKHNCSNGLPCPYGD